MWRGINKKTSSAPGPILALKSYPMQDFREFHGKQHYRGDFRALKYCTAKLNFTGDHLPTIDAGN